MKMADAIVATAAAHPSLGLLATETLSYQVAGVSNARDKIHGTFNPQTASFDFQTPRPVLSAIFVQRYGHGFGLPYRTSTDPNEGGTQPDADNRNYGWEEEENFPYPTDATLQNLGFPAGYKLSADGMDRTDMQACVRFTELVIRPLNAGKPIGTQVGGLLGPAAKIPTGGATVVITAPPLPAPVTPAAPAVSAPPAVAAPPLAAAPAAGPDLSALLGVLAASGGIAGPAAAPAPAPAQVNLLGQLTQLLQFYAMLRATGLVK